MSNVSKGGLFQDQRLSPLCVTFFLFFALQTSGGPELVTWSNLLSLGNKSAAENSASASAGIGDQGIINMEDDDSDEEDFSDHEIGMPGGTTGSTNANANSTLSSIFNSFNSNSPQSVIASNENQGSKPFEILRDLWCHHAHLAVFMNYVISNSDPSALVIYFYPILTRLKTGL